jgi:hypothetical protein
MMKLKSDSGTSCGEITEMVRIRTINTKHYSSVNINIQSQNYKFQTVPSYTDCRAESKALLRKYTVYMTVQSSLFALRR